MGLGSAAYAGSTPTQLSFSVCPNVTQTIYPGPAPGPDDLRFWTTQLHCGATVASAGYADCSGTPHANTDLGTFGTRQSPLGVAVYASAQASCATQPPELRPGYEGALTLSVEKTGFCPTTLTIPAQTRAYAVIFPIGSLSLGTYSVALNLPDQPSWIGTHATGTLHVGETSFTETDTNALARPGKSATFAALLDNSIAGQGAGQLVSTKTASGSVAKLTATDYYACGAINIEATVKYGKRAASGVARVTGDGLITGGTGNYKDLKGSFTVRGSYSAKTNRGTFALKGIATY